MALIKMTRINITRRFHGGIQPPEHKHLSSKSPVQIAALPKQVVLPLTADLEAIVAIGDKVKTGQLIASDKNPDNTSFTANLHTSISGEVVAVAPSIIINSDGQDTPFEYPKLANWREASDEQLLAIIQQAGLVGLGGAGFPSAVKIQGAYNKVSTLIINAAECEPYITADDLLLQTRAHEILEGIAILQQLLKPERILLGIEDNKPEAIQALEIALKEHPLQDQLSLCILPTRYPSGGEKQLIQLLTGKEVPSGKLPLAIGILCHNVGTLYALYSAVVLAQPLIERLATVTGLAVSQPANYWARIGTPVNQLLTAAGVNAEQASRVIVGGPLMGFTLDSNDYAITKTTNCLLVPTAAELPLPAAEQPCIRCGQCELVCPAQLLPQQLYFYAANQAYQQADKQQLFDCIECGACAWVCPSAIPLVQHYRHAKTQLRQLQADALKADRAKQRFEARNARLANETLEKEAKRQARAEATARLTAARKAPAATLAATNSAVIKNSAVVDNTQLKQLTIAIAACSSAVKKAEKMLSNLEVNVDATSEQIYEQLVKIDKAREQLAKAEARLAAKTVATKNVQETSQ